VVFLSTGPGSGHDPGHPVEQNRPGPGTLPHPSTWETCARERLWRATGLPPPDYAGPRASDAIARAWSMPAATAAASTRRNDASSSTRHLTAPPKRMQGSHASAPHPCDHWSGSPRPSHAVGGPDGGLTVAYLMRSGNGWTQRWRVAPRMEPHVLGEIRFSDACPAG
jgi:hypothetical protein